MHQEGPHAYLLRRRHVGPGIVEEEHLLRLGVLARRFGLRALGSPAPPSPIASNSRRELGYLLAESLKAPAALLFAR